MVYFSMGQAGYMDYRTCASSGAEEETAKGNFHAEVSQLYLFFLGLIGVLWYLVTQGLLVDVYH